MFSRIEKGFEAILVGSLQSLFFRSRHPRPSSETMRSRNFLETYFSNNKSRFCIFVSNWQQNGCLSVSFNGCRRDDWTHKPL